MKPLVQAPGPFRITGHFETDAQARDLARRLDLPVARVNRPARLRYQLVGAVEDVPDLSDWRGEFSPACKPIYRVTEAPEKLL